MNYDAPAAETRRVTRLLRRVEDGDSCAYEELMPLVYEDLRRRAESLLGLERAGHTLQATALVHEAYLRLHELDSLEWSHREHFFAVAATCMRRVLVDHARRRGAVKRGEGRAVLSLEEAGLIPAPPQQDLLVLDEALERLAAHAARKARVAELKLFAGLEHQGIALILGVSVPTVERDWRYARAFLRRELNE